MASTIASDIPVIITPASLIASRQTLVDVEESRDLDDDDDDLGLAAVPFRREHSAPSPISTRLSLSPQSSWLTQDDPFPAEVCATNKQPRGTAAGDYLRRFGLEPIPFRREVSAPSGIGSEPLPPSPATPTKGQTRSLHHLDSPSASERVKHVAEQVRLMQLYSSPKRKSSADHDDPLPRGLRLLDVVVDSPNEREPSVAIL